MTPDPPNVDDPTSTEYTLEDEFNVQLEEMRDLRIDRCGSGQPGKRNALARWFCQQLIGITAEDENEDAVAIGCPPSGSGPSGGGVGDKGVDFFCILDDGSTDESEKEIHWGQCKLGDNLDYTFTEKDLDDLKDTIGYLENNPPDANKIFSDRSSAFIQAGGMDGKAQKIIYIVVAGSLSAPVKSKINPESEYYKKHFGQHTTAGNVRLEVYDLERLLREITTPEIPNVRLHFVEKPIYRLIDQHQSLIGYIKATELIKHVKRVGLANLIAYNPRTFKGKTARPNKGIEETLQDSTKRGMFWKLNNGLTVTCEKLELIDDGIDAAREVKFYEITDMRIVNGAQTTSTLMNNQGHVADDLVEIGIKIYETANDEERLAISKATNTQNPIREIDLMSQRPEHSEMVRQCRRSYPEFWYEKQSYSYSNVKNSSTKKRVTPKRVLDKGKTAYSFYAYAIDPYQAIKLNDSKFFDPYHLDLYYNRVFFDPTEADPQKIRSVRELILPHIFHNILAELQNHVLKKQNIQMRKWANGGRVGENPRTTTVDDSKLVHGELFMVDGDADEDLTESERLEKILLKEYVKQYVLNWIYRSLHSFSDDERKKIEDEIIVQFSKIENADRIPIQFLRIASAAYNNFIDCYDYAQQLWEDKRDPNDPTAIIKVPPSDTEMKHRLESAPPVTEVLVRNRMMFHQGDERRFGPLTTAERFPELHAFLPDED
jgi:hypothetical protein